MSGQALITRARQGKGASWTGRWAHRGFSLVELMVGMVIGFITLAVIVQSLSVFEVHKTTTTAAADAQENGLLALSAIERDTRRAAAGFNHPALLQCQLFFSAYQEVSGTGAPVAVGAAAPLPLLIEDGAVNDRISLRIASYLEGVVPTVLTEDQTVLGGALVFTVDRGFQFRGEPINAGDPPADLILVADREPVLDPILGTTLRRCALMNVSTVVASTDGASTLTVQHGPSGKKPEYNASIAFMTSNHWPGFGLRGTVPFRETSYVFRLGSTAAGGIVQRDYEINANQGLQAVINGMGNATTEVLANDVVALQAQYGISATPGSREITQWVNPSGATWGSAALNPPVLTAAVTDNRLRIKAVRIAVVARSGKREGEIVTTACTENNALAASNFGPCSWTDDSAASPAPAIDLRAAPGDTEWQHYRYRVYQTIIPMRNLLWPNL